MEEYRVVRNGYRSFKSHGLLNITIPTTLYLSENQMPHPWRTLGRGMICKKGLFRFTMPADAVAGAFVETEASLDGALTEEAFDDLLPVDSSP